MSERIIFHLDMDAFFAAIEQRDDPSLKGKPVIVGADPKNGKGRGVVSTCSYEARKYGVHSAQPISKAYQLCPQGVYLPVNFKKYRQASDIIHQIFYEFTPDVEPISIDEAFLDMSGCYHLHQTPTKAAAALKKRIWDKIALTASVGIAPIKMVAKMASDLSKPDGLLEVKSQDVLKFLAPLGVERLWGVGPKTRKILNNMGIQTIGDIRALPLKYLLDYFGDHGQHLSDLAHGLDPREVKSNEEAKSISHEHTFEEDTDNVEDVLSVMLELSEQVSRRLRKAKLKSKTVSIKIRLEDFKTFTRATTLFENTNLVDVIYKNAKELFLEFYNKQGKIRLIGVRASNWEDLYGQDLFPDETKEKLEKVHQALDSIKDRFGENSIHRAL